MGNIKIYLLTFIANFVFGVLSVLGINGAIHIASKSTRSASMANIGAWFIILFLIVLLIAVNVFCFKFCKTHMTGGLNVYVINVIMLVTGIALAFIAYFTVLAFIAGKAR